MSRLSPEEVGLHSLRPKPGSRRPRKRVGRGGGSGLGKTSGRGSKGIDIFLCGPRTLRIRMWIGFWPPS